MLRDSVVRKLAEAKLVQGDVVVLAAGDLVPDDGRLIEASFMLVIGPVSSQFDFLTFYVLLKVLDANESLFQTGWFVESLATQVLVIFVIRTRYIPFGHMASRPGGVLIGVAVLIIVLAIMLTFTPLGAYFGFVPLPRMFFAVLAAMVVAYLLLAQLTKYLFYRFAMASGASSNRV